jgi:hypothetical protein
VLVAAPFGASVQVHANVQGRRFFSISFYANGVMSIFILQKWLDSRSQGSDTNAF